LLLGAEGAAVPLSPLALSGSGADVSEETLQRLIHTYPATLPISEIDPMFAGAVPICCELKAGDGAIDNFMVTASGLPVLVECKLWRNPQARREVVGQILDYAKVLSRWSSSDLQREVSRHVKRDGNPVLELVREAGHDVDEADFNDALTLNFRRGRFLLLIVGDGIREGVEALTDYLQAHAGLHFSLGLVEIPIYVMPSGERLVVPRVLARTHVVTRTVVAVPEGSTLQDDDAAEHTAEQMDEMTADRVDFWKEFVSGLKLDDPEQPIPNVGRQGYVAALLPVQSGSAWLTIFRSVKDGKAGLFLSFTRNSVGERVVRRIVEDWAEVKAELGGTVTLFDDHLGRPLIHDSLFVGSLSDAGNRQRAMTWLRTRLNEFVNVLRPRIKAIAADLKQENS
jgi:hypothetical protein